MKKFILAFAAIAVMVCTAMSFAACSNNDDDDQEQVDDTKVVYSYYVETSVTNGGKYEEIKAQLIADAISTLQAVGCERLSSTTDSGDLAIKASGSSYDETVAKAIYNTLSHDNAFDTSKFYGTMALKIERTRTNGVDTSVQVCYYKYEGTMEH